MFRPTENTNAYTFFPYRWVNNAAPVGRTFAAIILNTFNCCINVCASLVGRVSWLFSREERQRPIDLSKILTDPSEEKQIAVLSDRVKNLPEHEIFRQQLETICEWSNENMEELIRTKDKVHCAVLVILFQTSEKEWTVRALSSTKGIVPAYEGVVDDLKNVLDYEFYSYQFYDTNPKDPVTVYNSQHFNRECSSLSSATLVGFEAFNKIFDLKDDLESPIKLEEIIDTSTFI